MKSVVRVALAVAVVQLDIITIAVDLIVDSPGRRTPETWDFLLERYERDFVRERYERRPVESSEVRREREKRYRECVNQKALSALAASASFAHRLASRPFPLKVIRRVVQGAAVSRAEDADSSCRSLVRGRLTRVGVSSS